MFTLIIFMYLYSCIGYYMFSDDTPKFGTVLDSFITMFQMLVGEGWHEVSLQLTSRYF